VTVAGDRVTCVVASFQHAPSAELSALVRSSIVADEYLVNPAGEWSLGGFDADSGISGRKIVIDNYGPEIGVGGGSFSGKDFTKVDRSGAYIARRIAVDYLARFSGAQAVRVKLAYAIGKAEPVMAVAEVSEGFGGAVRVVPVEGYDLTPAGIATLLRFDAVCWADTAAWGHFGREFSWG
jgi:S-adenosylmethionine synthetase